MIGPISSQLNAIKWGEFRLGDLFEVLSSKKIYHANTIKIHDTQIENSYPYVVRAATNNGIKGFIVDDPTFTNEKNTLSFAQDTFTVFYQKQPYFTGNKVKILKPKFAFKSPKILHFISAILQFILKPLTWGLGSTTESIAEFKFSLPLKPTANAQTFEDIDFTFMEKFIAELEQCRLAELEQCRLAELQAYLKATGLENTTLSNDEENALNVFNGNHSGGNTPCGLTWQSFKLGDLFEIRPTKAYNLTNPHLFDSNAKNPVVTNSSLNNGISGYSSLEPTEKGNQITYSDTTTSEGIFYQKRPFIGYSHVQGLYPLKYHEFWNEKTLLYIVVAFKKVACGRFDYGNKFNRKIASEMSIILPTNPHGGIDFNFMRTLINALMKQTIQGVVQYSSTQIQATKEIINQEAPVQKDSLF
ncbi:type II restriction endonuclease [Helicobacter pylori]|uniref:restriction endonuclease subunit S n=1 Tax=Helicobacter pylori TaxID=210 RepID=UPI0009A267D4|nr:restriction endonuclease subunit S [Helicobacter pylori]NHB12985.1 type II restriction endonuclease [Helicobacter pylori]OPG19358.1 type II restriction endonuclease [Helicobacter pylori]QEF38224.1 type II restriction endonuclease [Helicobacter pylori]